MMINKSPARQKAIEWARGIRALNPVYVDTETTGLGRDDEIIEISVIDDEGQVLIETLVRPSKPIPPDSIRIHGIHDADVQNARTWPAVWSLVRGALFGRTIVLYNEDFDIRMMQQSHRVYGLDWKERLKTQDLMKRYAEFRGEWDPRRGSYRFHSLANAGMQCNISLPNSHRTTADTLLTRALLHYIADCG